MYVKIFFFNFSMTLHIADPIQWVNRCRNPELHRLELLLNMEDRTQVASEHQHQVIKL